MRIARSSSGRIEWAIIDGRLKETGPESPTFTMTATDTFTLATLLMTEYTNIVKAAQQEQGIASGELHPYTAMRKKLAAKKKYEDDLAEGAEGIELSDVTFDLPEIADAT